MPSIRERISSYELLYIKTLRYYVTSSIVISVISSTVNSSTVKWSIDYFTNSLFSGLQRFPEIADMSLVIWIQNKYTELCILSLFPSNYSALYVWVRDGVCENCYPYCAQLEKEVIEILPVTRNKTFIECWPESLICCCCRCWWFYDDRSIFTIFCILNDFCFTHIRKLFMTVTPTPTSTPTARVPFGSKWLNKTFKDMKRNIFCRSCWNFDEFLRMVLNLCIECVMLMFL